MLEPVLADAPLLEEILAVKPSRTAFQLWWLGQSGFLLHWHDHYLLLDPYLSESLTEKYAGTDKPHVRMTRRPIDPAQLTMIDIATSSHNHTDHLDAATLGPLLTANPAMEILVPAANRSFAADRLRLPEDRLTAIDAGEAVTIDEFTFHAVPAAHEEMERDDQGRCRYLGYVVTFGDFALYHSGDTVRYAGQVELLRRWELDVAILPINGRAPERRVAGNLWGAEAAQLAHELGAAVAIPCHYDMFTFNTATPEEFLREAGRLGQRTRVLRCGERFNWPAPAE